MNLPAPQSSTVPLYAGFWRRGAACMLDSVVLNVPAYILEAAIGQSIYLYTFITVALSCGYFAGFHSSRKQATPGKLVFGIKVCGQDGERIALARAIGRYFASWLSAFTLMIGFLMAAFTKKKQALHDLFLETLVVNAKAERAEIVAGGGTMPVTGGVWAAVVVLGVLSVGAGLVAGIMMPAYHDYNMRTKVSDALASISTLQNEIQSDMAQKRAIRARSIPGASPNVENVAVNANGAILIHLKPEVAGGRRIILTPVLGQAGAVESWTCSAEGIPGQLVPASCRIGKQ